MATDNLSSLLESLQLECNKKDDTDSKLSEQLEKLIYEITKEVDRTSVCEEIVRSGIFKIVILALKDDHKEVQSKGAELIAELAKVESCRLACVEEGVISVLVEKMASNDAAVMVQTCRALGNICYEYDGGRSQVMMAGGASQLLSLLKRAADYSDTPENHQVRLVATGFLLNLLNSYETDEQGDSMATLLVDVLVLYLDKFAANEDIPTHILLSFSCLSDADITRELVISKNINPQLIKVLKENSSAEVIETCLELITNLAETERVKTQLSTGGMCEAVIEVVKRYNDDSSSELSGAIIKTATDLIVLVLVGDESMTTLYGNGETAVYREMITWLTSSSDDLRIAGALAMGNFARNDAHCIQMVKNDVAEKLLQVLGSHSTVEGDLRLQHAVLAALRNLSIAKQNKIIIIEQNVLETLLPMAEVIQTYPVVFKLLATLRMIIDGQSEAAIKVGKSKIAVGRMVEWSLTNEHPGIQGEASRLLAWIIKNCKGDSTVINDLVEAGSLKPLAIMLSSEHAVMVNEAGLGLALAFSTNVNSSIIKSLTDDSFMTRVENVLKRQDLPPETIGNVVSMLIALSRSDDNNRELIKTDGIKSGVESHKTIAKEDVKSLVLQLSEILYEHKAGDEA